MKKIIHFTLLAVLSSSSLTAQTTFQKTYGTSGSEGSFSIHQSNDQGYIISGIAADQSIYALKTNALGETLWSNKYFGGLSSANAITNDGGYIIAGYMSDQVIGCNDFKLIKLDANGTAMWSHIYLATEDAMNISVIQTADNGYLVAGTTDSIDYSTSQNYDFKIVKVDANGLFEWSKTYGSPGANDDEKLKSIQQTTDLGYILFGDKNGETYLIKTDALGNTLWANTYGTSDEEYGNSVQQTLDGGYVIAGGSINSGGTDGTIYVCKIDASGTVSWSKNIGGAGAETANSIRQTTDGSYLIVGQTTSFGAGNVDVFLMKLDSNGGFLWSNNYGGSGEERGLAFDLTEDGGAIITGYTSSFGAGGLDIYVIKTDNNGVSNCNEISSTPQVTDATTTTTSAITPKRNWGGPGNDIPFSSASNPGIITNVACESASVDENNLPTEELIVFPNPSTDRINLSGIQNLGINKIEISDIMGKLFISENLSNISNEDGSFSVKFLPKGVYFIKLKTDNNLERTLKIIKE